MAVSRPFLLLHWNMWLICTRNHVIGDLEPFICVFSHCLEGGYHGLGTGPLTFETSKAWSSHMQTAHGHAWECRAPSHDPIVFGQEIQYQEHSIKEHGVPETYAGTLSNAARRPVLDKVLECPFGDEFQPLEKVESSAVFSSSALQSHVAGHMKEIALLTLQKLPRDDDENAENVDSNQPLEDDGPAGPLRIRRASMCSILDDENLDFQDDDSEDADGNVGHRRYDVTLLAGSYVEAQRSDDVCHRLEGLRIVLDEPSNSLLAAVIVEIRLVAHRLREVGDLSQVYRDRFPLVWNSLNVLLPCLSRSLRDMTVHFEDRSRSKSSRWQNMYYAMAAEAEGLSLPARFATYNQFAALIRDNLIG